MARKARTAGRSRASARRGGAAVPALQQRATQLYRSGQLGEALQACREILALEPDRPDVLGFAGMIALKRGDCDDAVKYYSAAVAGRPDYAEAHYNLGNALKKLKRLDEAAAAYERAARIRPDLAPAHHNLGSVLQSLERYEEAAAAYRRTLAMMPQSVETIRNLGMVLQKLGRMDDAIAAFRRVLEIEPGWLLIYSNLVPALMEKGEAGGAVDACKEWLASDPRSSEAMARLAIALLELGDRRAARDLLDFDRFVRQEFISPPADYADLAAFNEALADHICNHPTLKIPPEDDPTYHHPRLQITEEILIEPKGPVGQLEDCIRAAIERYRSTLDQGPDHPFPAAWPERWRLTAWGTLLNGEGNLVPHIHPEGYFGGVYYVELPDVVAMPEHEQAGWFELGRPPPELHGTADPEICAIQPEVGKMLLFPAYFYHRTIPYQSGQRRISIAFDIIPED